MHIEKITIDPDRYPVSDAYPFNTKILQIPVSLELTSPIAIFVGENGCGKSTLLEAVARRCGIHIWEGGYRTTCQYNPHEKQLYRFITAPWRKERVPGSYFSSQIFRAFTRNVDDWASTDPAVLDHYGGKSLLIQSHGQSLMAYFTNRYTKKGIYFLDEPETALSPRHQLGLRDLIAKVAGDDAQFIIATHSPILLSCPGGQIFSFDSDKIRQIACEDTDHFRVYRDFFLRSTRKQ